MSELSGRFTRFRLGGWGGAVTGNRGFPNIRQVKIHSYSVALRKMFRMCFVMRKTVLEFFRRKKIQLNDIWVRTLYVNDYTMCTRQKHHVFDVAVSIASLTFHIFILDCCVTAVRRFLQATHMLTRTRTPPKHTHECTTTKSPQITTQRASERGRQGS